MGRENHEKGGGKGLPSSRKIEREKELVKTRIEKRRDRTIGKPGDEGKIDD